MTTSRPTMNNALIERATSWLDMDLLCILYQILIDTKELDIHIFQVTTL